MLVLSSPAFGNVETIEGLPVFYTILSWAGRYQIVDSHKLLYGGSTSHVILFRE